MPTNDRVPAGRAGRLWLVHRLSVAERGADQLERKAQLVGAEVVRRRAAAEQRRLEWAAACQQADRWMLRAGLIGGFDGPRQAWAPPVDIAIGWTNTMGVRHPQDVTIAGLDAPDVVTTTAALVMAREAFVTAMRAAAEVAVADAGITALEASLLATRLRARILRRHWIPRLRGRLHELAFALEQAEQEDQARLRRTAL
jgi:vacuolar-type H+-ATPase subunit D/Vma8